MSDNQKTLYRYLSLSLLFGLAFGVRFTLDVWTFRLLGGGSGARFVLVAVSLLAMLIGDLGAAQIAARSGFRKAIAFASGALVLWSVCTSLAVYLQRSGLMFASAVGFGLALGGYHSCVDAWFDYKHRRVFGKPANDSDLTFGYWLYNAGYLVGATLAFPMLIRLSVRTLLSAVRVDDLGISPYVVVLAVAVAIYSLRPNDSLRTLSEHRTAPNAILDVIRSGGGAFVLAVLVGAAVSVLIQFIDHFAPSLIAHSTIYSQVLELALLNGIICAGMGLSAWLTSRAAGPLSQRRRSVVIVSGLSIAILVLSYLTWRGSQSVVVAALLGVVQAFLVCLPPLLKAQVLQSIKNSADNAIGLSVLGASKRIAALPVAAAVVAMERRGAAPADSEHVLYLVLWAVGVIAAIGTAAWGLRGPVQSEVIALSGEES